VRGCKSMDIQIVLLSDRYLIRCRYTMYCTFSTRICIYGTSSSKLFFEPREILDLPKRLYEYILLRPELQRNPRAICRSHRQSQLFSPQSIIGRFDSFQPLYQTNGNVGSSVDGKLVSETHPRACQERDVSVWFRGDRIPTFRSEDFCIRSPMLFPAVKAIQRHQDGRTLGQSYRGLSVGASAYRQGCVSRCGAERPWDGGVATQRC
jgi:hypothetical protein